MLVLGITLIEEVVATILIDDIVVDRAILGSKELARLTLETGEVLIGISIVADE